VKDTRITTMMNMRLSLLAGPMSPYLGGWHMRTHRRRQRKAVDTCEQQSPHAPPPTKCV
jgi:hypothetical protein